MYQSLSVMADKNLFPTLTVPGLVQQSNFTILLLLLILLMAEPDRYYGCSSFLLQVYFHRINNFLIIFCVFFVIVVNSDWPLCNFLHGQSYQTIL